MNPQPTPFRVTVTPPCKQQILALARKAKEVGVAEQFKQALLEVERRLLHEPREWGDPYHAVPGLRAVKYARVLRDLQLRVDSLIHDQQPVVLLAAIQAVADSPLAGRS